nr:MULTISPECIES: GIY-YIG nuclease family protein [unclassified Thalassolituus]
MGDASVPFEFDVHAMIFSEDAPTLEKELHRHFQLDSVNKVNPRKSSLVYPCRLSARRWSRWE